jgi:hypothetical protein
MAPLSQVPTIIYLKDVLFSPVLMSKVLFLYGLLNSLLDWNLGEKKTQPSSPLTRQKSTNNNFITGQ